MKNGFGSGDAMQLTAPAGGVVSGLFYLLGDLLVCAGHNAAAGATFEAWATGTYDGVPKATGQAWTEGAIIYWDNTNRVFTTTASGNKKVGHAVAAAVSAATTGRVRVQVL